MRSHGAWWVALAMVAGILGFPALAAADREFTPRFSTNASGDVLLAANTLMTCASSASGCSAAQAGGTGNNNGFTMQPVDVDGDPSTANSSRARLDLPAGSRVLFAGLYWTADGQGLADQNARRSVRFRAPGDGAYRTLGPTGTVLDTGTIGGHQAYQGFQDVTSIVQAAGGGAYTVGGVAARTGATDLWAGWALVVVVEDPSQPARNLTVFDGLKSINSTAPPSTIQISGFQTPPAGQVRTRVGVVAAEGDRGTTGDTASLDGRRLTDALTPATNFFNSTLSRDGVRLAGGDPDHANTLGFDAKIVQADGFLANGATSASLTLTTNGDAYLPGVVTFATDLYAPKLEATKTVENVTRPGEPARHGDRLRYVVEYRNSGLDGAGNLILRDPLPAGVGYVAGTLRQTAGPGGPGAAGPTDAAGDDVGEYDGASRTLVLRGGANASATAGGRLAPGESLRFTFDVTVDGDVVDGAQIANVAHAGFDAQTLGTVFGDVPSPPAVTPVVAPDLTIAKSHAGSIVAGLDTTFSLTVRNVGGASSVGPITVTDDVDGGAFSAVASASGSGWSCTVTPQPGGDRRVVCTTTATVAPGADLPPIELVATAADPLPAQVANTGVVAGGDDANPANNAATDAAPGTSRADLRVTKRSDAARAIEGDVVTWTVAVENAGPSTAVAATLSDPMPPGLTVLDVSSDRGTCTTAVSCQLGDLPRGATATITIRTRVAGNDTTITNVATAASATTEANLADNEASAELRVDASADLSVAKRVEIVGPNDPPVAGDDLDYRLTIHNDGPGAAERVRLSDPLPDGYEWVSTSADPPLTCDPPTGGAIVCTATSLPAGATATVRVHGRILRGGRFDNRASVGSATADPDPSDNDDSTTTIARPAADLQLTKLTRTRTPIAPGETGIFDLRLVNAGPSVATAARIVDELPAGLTFVSSSDPRCTAAGRTVSCAVGDLAIGDAQAFTVAITVRVDDAASPGATLLNAADAGSDLIDPYPANHAEDSLVVGDRPPGPGPGTGPGPGPGGPGPGQGPGPGADPGPSPSGRIAISKRASRSRVRAGGRVDFRIRIRAIGGRVAQAEVCDTLPRGLAFAARDGLRIRGRRGCVTVRDVVPGKPRTVKIRTRVLASTRPLRLRNVATAAVDGQAVRRAGATIQVRPSRARGGGVTG